MWGLWGRTEGAGCGGAPELGAWRNGVKGQKEKRGRAWWPEVRCPECGGKREVGGGVVSALRLGEGGQEVGGREWKARILKKPGVWGLGGRGGEGAWAWERMGVWGRVWPP